MGSVQIPSRTLAACCVGLLLMMVSGKGSADLYHNSFISPNSANQPKALLKSIESTNEPIGEFSPSDVIEGSSVHKERVERSADPILSKTSAGDTLILYKNIEDAFESNDVELSGRLGNFIQPSKTDKDGYFGGLHATSGPASGEGRGALQGRSLHEPQDITPTATVTTSATPSINLDKPRQANPDIQDIITGLVKLLNGNVNVQTNTAPGGMGRPLRPVSTRINNRGPPQITDVPDLPPDFDVPAPPLPPPPMSTRHPYPFDLPPNNMSPKRPYGGTGIPLGAEGGGKRPGFYRPVTIPPWHRRRPSKRPNPNIPHYRPMPTMSNSDLISLTSEKPQEDILTLDLGSQFEGPHDNPHDNSHENAHNSPHESPKDSSHEDHQDYPHEESVHSELVVDREEEGDTRADGIESVHHEATTNSILDVSEGVDLETAEFERNKEKNPKPEKSTKVTLVKPTMKTNLSILETPISLITEDSITPSFTSNSFSSSFSSSSSLSSKNSSIISPSNVSKEAISTTEIAATSNFIESSIIQPSVSSIIPLIESSIHEGTLEASVASAPDSASSLNPSSTETPSLSAPLIPSLSYSSPVSSSPSSSSSSSSSFSSLETSTAPPIEYRPRPGIVLDDTEYKPGKINQHQPIITRPPVSAIGDVFDITVSAIQGQGEASTASGHPYIIPVELDHLGSQSDVITSPMGSEGFVSIDGKRTYLNLFGENPEPTSVAAVGVKPSAPSNNQVVQGTSFVEQEKPVKPNYGSVKPARRPQFGRPRPGQQPPVRIDTCIVGDDSTCDVSQHEICRTESGVSACHCRPGTARRKHRDPCRKIVSVLVSLRVDRIYERRIVWANELLEKSSDSYEQLSFEAERALESAMSMTPFSDEYLGSKVNNIYQGDRSQGHAGVFVNITLQLEENADTSRPSVRGDIQKHLLGVIQRRSNNVGNSALWVDSPPGSVSSLQDLDECSSPDLHDCHAQADCVNTFGSFKCECRDGFRDPWGDNKHRAGRHCEQCPSSHCNNRGECKYSNGQEICSCTGNYYGTQCELDGEVLGVAIGASVAAIIIIGLTLVCLVMWSRKWSREQKAAVGSPVFGYMATASNTVKTPVMGAPPYQLTLEDRLRWAQIADVMAQANHYAPEPGLAPTRPSSAMFGYPTLPINNTLQRHPASIYGGATGALPPVPMPRLTLQAQLASKAASVQSMKHLDNSSSSEEEDKIDLLGRNFHVPRPKSRSNASIANQSGIYYDVDYDQNEIYKPGGIPMKVLTGIGGCRLNKNDYDFWLYDDFHSERKRGKSPTTSL
ncbi:uncharacterized protein pwn isoform X2 [Euwallacea similis]|uniref:uncharacterized protein pwn isoform X2 n=1 Tax=Euwallacea similis TaxID=1736056 RepID=UPI0034505F9B